MGFGVLPVCVSSGVFLVVLGCGLGMFVSGAPLVLGGRGVWFGCVIWCFMVGPWSGFDFFVFCFCKLFYTKHTYRPTVFAHPNTTLQCTALHSRILVMFWGVPGGALVFFGVGVFPVWIWYGFLAGLGCMFGWIWCCRSPFLW